MPPQSRKRAGRFSESLPPVELVVVADSTGATIDASDVAGSMQVERQLHGVLPRDASLSRPFGSASRLNEKLRGTEAESRGTELLSFFTVTSSEDPEGLAQTLRDAEGVRSVFVKPPAEPPIAPEVEDFDAVAVAQSQGIDAPPVTADFSANQGYLDAAPGGIDARWAWTRPGGRGDGVRVIDVEGAWRFSHEDLVQNQGGVIGGTQSNDVGWRNHGTAVAGEISGDLNTFGITGIAPMSNIRAISIFGGLGSAGAIRAAADALSPGDILLIELHRPGPRHNFASRDDQRGYIAIEWWPDDFAAIRYALGRGVIVVEAAGNGAENLDDALYDTAAAGFPGSWRNPFRGAAADSGAIIVGAGAPSSGNQGPARSRLDFSNFGSRLDVQGWGREVVTAGYGDLQGGTNEDLWYTARFSGTSSASPIVVGAIAAYQGISAAGSGRKTPAQARERLRATGSAQQDAPNRPISQRIGNLPNIRAMAGVIKVKDVKDAKSEKLETKEFKNEKIEVKERKESKLEKLERKELKLEKLERKEFQEVIDPRVLGGGSLQGGGLEPGAAGGMDRITMLEQAVQELQHFIGQALRPDLGGGALGYEDIQGQAAASKQEKDLKDVEKLPES